MYTTWGTEWKLPERKEFRDNKPGLIFRVGKLNPCDYIDAIQSEQRLLQKGKGKKGYLKIFQAKATGQLTERYIIQIIENKGKTNFVQIVN